ncbi:MAG: hypothetical protein ACOCUU_01035 [Nanoarchaeota archaeon]
MNKEKRGRLGLEKFNQRNLSNSINFNINFKLALNFRPFLVFLILIFSLTFSLSGVFGATWNDTAVDTTYYALEDTPYFHDLRNNVTDYNENVSFKISDDTVDNITWINYQNETKEFVYNGDDYSTDISPWVFIKNSSKGNFTMNASNDNQTGFFGIPMRVIEGDEKSTRTFSFIINATNDAPEFVNITENSGQYENSTANYTSYISSDGGESEINITLNASDEEEHYPLDFDVSFDSCNFAQWSDRNSSEEGGCDLSYNWSNVSNSGEINSSKIINFYNLTENDVGTYNLSFCVNDTLPSNESELPLYRSADYNQSRQTCENFTLDLKMPLTINVSNCTGISMLDNETKNCFIEIRTENKESNLTLNSSAFFLNSLYDDNIFNSSWFYSNTSGLNAENYTYTVNITLNPEEKKEVGFWNISFTGKDVTSELNDDATSQTEFIYINVSRSENSIPILSGLENVETSVLKKEVINFNISDDDLLIPDKSVYNESFNITYTFFNISGGISLENAEEIEFSNFSFEPLERNISTNISQWEFVLTPEQNESGNYLINISIKDNSTQEDFDTFNLTIISNNPPQWNMSKQYYFVVEEDNSSWQGINLSEYVNDTDGDDINFSYEVISDDSNNDSFDSLFSINETTGFINFTSKPEDKHVGNHSVRITAFDGYLTNSSVFNFTINNVHDTPVINEFRFTDNSGAQEEAISGSSINISEENTTTFELFVKDDDYLIKQKDFYNESLIIKNLTINGTNESLFEFEKRLDLVLSSDGENIAKFKAEFTPTKSDIGDYNVTIVVGDNSSETEDVNFSFEMHIGEINNAPVIHNLTNFTTRVGEDFYYQINATDEEDNITGLSFSYNVTEGEDIFNEGFNTSTGEFNLTFNESEGHGGIYKLEINVTDSGTENNSNISTIESFFIYVYDTPIINSPAESYNFTNISEGQEINLTFNVNHSIGDNLTYEFYLDNISYCNINNNNTDCPSNTSNFTYSNLSLRNSFNSYGNGSNFTLRFNPTYLDETYGLYKNLTLIVYPKESSLNNNYNFNMSELNNTQIWKINISHSNSVFNFTSDVDDYGEVTWDNDIEIDLRNHFKDYDYSDSYYNQPINFSVYSNVSNGTSEDSNINSEFLKYDESQDGDGWKLVLSVISEQETNEDLWIKGCEGDSILASSNESANESCAIENISSNVFNVKFTEPEEKEIPANNDGPSPSGSSSTRTVEKPVSLKIITSGYFSVYKKGKLEIPITLENRGETDLKNINLTKKIIKDMFLAEGVDSYFGKSFFDSLDEGEEKNTSLTIEMNTNETGLYEIFINASVKNPEYEDWTKIQLKVTERNISEIQKQLIFTDEYIIGNPECAELRDIVKEAEKLYEKGDYSKAMEKASQAINACNEALEKTGEKTYFSQPQEEIFNFLIIFSLIVVFLGVSYYIYKRIRIK